MKALTLAFVWTTLMFAVSEIPIEGNASSQVRVIIYEDLQCPDCSDFRVMLDEKLLPKYGKSVAFEHRDFPLPKHAWARKSAIAARMIAEKNPELCLEWRRYSLAHIKQINAGSFEDTLLAWAKDHGVNTAKLVMALDDKMLNAAVEHDFQEGIARGVSKTPTAFVDGEPFVETIVFEEISAAIDKAIK